MDAELLFAQARGAVAETVLQTFGAMRFVPLEMLRRAPRTET